MSKASEYAKVASEYPFCSPQGAHVVFRVHEEGHLAIQSERHGIVVLARQQAIAELVAWLKETFDV